MMVKVGIDEGVEHGLGVMQLNVLDCIGGARYRNEVLIDSIHAYLSRLLS